PTAHLPPLPLHDALPIFPSPAISAARTAGWLKGRLQVARGGPTNSCSATAQTGGRKVNRKGARVERIAAVVLAAGKGTRMKSDRVKVLHRICGRPLAWFPVRAAFAL